MLRHAAGALVFCTRQRRTHARRQAARLAAVNASFAAEVAVVFYVQE
jgi:hypothetical protein